VNPFGHVFWKLCLFEVEAAVLKSGDSFLLLLLYLLIDPLPFSYLAGCLALFFFVFAEC